MKAKKFLLGAVILITTILIILMQSSTVFASNIVDNLEIRVTEMVEHSDIVNGQIGYSIGEPRKENGVATGTKIWNIQQKKSGSTFEDTDLYCVKSAQGFTDTNKTAIYKQAYDMKSESSDVIEGTNPIIKNISADNYKGLQALADLIYIPGEDSESKLEELMNLQTAHGNACKDVDGYEVYQLKNYYDLLKAVQQSAIWYFTNSADNSNLYDQTGSNKTGWLKYTTDGNDYTNDLEEYDLHESDKGEILANQAYQLYKNLIAQAKKNASEGKISANTKMTVYTDDGGRGSIQPLMKIERVPAEFDLALKKYITSVKHKDGTTLEGRTIQVNTDPLKNGETDANYTLSKDPVSVKVGDEVTYNIAIYNEGNVKARAETIVDQLPTGLVLDKTKTEAITGNAKYTFTYDENNNKVTIQLSTASTNTDDAELEAFNEATGAIDSTIIQVVCTVGNQASGETLTNVAWITKSYDLDNFKEGEDRDSDTTKNPNVTKDDIDENYNNKEDDDDYDRIEVEPEGFDLALNKVITEVNGNSVTPSRWGTIDVRGLNKEGSNSYKDAKYNLVKEPPVPVETGNIVTYTFRVYNEGFTDGYAKEITENIPDGLQFLGGSYQATTAEETAAIQFNEEQGWKEAQNGKITTDKLADEKIPAFGENPDGTRPASELKYAEVQLKLKVIDESTTGKRIKNVAEISKAEDDEGNTPEDRDSTPGNNIETEDDQDYDSVVLPGEPNFDLKLIKIITERNKNKVIPSRLESIDVSKLNTEKADSQTTADYKFRKDPLVVETGDILKYTFRVYNEGYVDAYADEITENIPDGLEFLWSEKKGTELNNDSTLSEEEKEAIKFNQEMLWTYTDSSLKTIKTTYLSKETSEDNLIPKFDYNDGTKTQDDLKYKEVSVMLRVTAEELDGSPITNIAEITKTEDDKENENPDDRDSTPGNNDPDEDDQDEDKIILQSLDLALRKFIIAVSHDDEVVTDSEYLRNSDGTYTRAPKVDGSKLGTTDSSGNKITDATYTVDKSEPVVVTQGSNVVYMIRVYNESNVAGYAGEITDILPENLEFIDNDFNKQYGWDVASDGKTVKTKYLENTKIDKIEKGTETSEDSEDSETIVHYQEVPIMCKVSSTAPSDKNMKNVAEITEYLDENKNPIPEDIDSTPGNQDKKHEDDDDTEELVAKKFDLELKKWTTQAIVSYNGKQAVSNTGHGPYDNPEDVVKLEIPRDKLNSVTIKFKYAIRVYNQGGVEGYAKEIKDYVPQGLVFNAADNPGWTDNGNNVVSTRALENKLLQPGEYTDVELILTWQNGENNIGLKTNNAEISEDDNPYGLPDCNSTPDNKVPGENDIDDAEVMLSISTGAGVTYFGLGLTILATIGTGIFLIKKYVL